MNIPINVDARKRADDGLARIDVTLPGSLALEVALPFRDLFNRFGSPTPTALETLVLAASCYAIDKTVARAGSADRWTRNLDVEFPVVDPPRWQSATPALQQALSFLSGDEWTMSFTTMTGRAFRPKRDRQSRSLVWLPEVDEVCLFSGGLDSLAGAIDLLASGKRVLLIGHHDTGGPQSQQSALYQGMRPKYLGKVELHQVWISQRPGKANDTTLRSRSFIFLAAGFFAAKALGDDVPVCAPENGVIAVNVPLTPSRMGSCSTRTMHPFFLTNLQAALRPLGMTNPLHTPFALSTKGECLERCADVALLKRLADLSVSCSHPSRRQYWNRRASRNCGYCVPCIYRRAALYSIGVDEGMKYGRDICAGELSLDSPEESANDFRAIVSYLRRDPSVEEIQREIHAIAPIASAKEHARTVRRGIEEVRAFLRGQCVRRVRDRLAGAI